MFCPIYLHVVLYCDDPTLVEYLLPQALMAKISLVLITQEIPELIKKVELEFSQVLQIYSKELNSVDLTLQNKLLDPIHRGEFFVWPV